VGHPHPMRTVIDAHLSTFDVIWAAAGTPRTVFATTYDELLRLTHATAADIGSAP
jgi:prolyl-tRNA editing enzyme YbaK/EbsC (Cys-tRNA(Pro) deacylase)